MTQSESEVTPRSPPGEPLNVRTWPRQARAASRDRVRGGVRRGGAAGLLSAFRVGRVTAGAESRWLRVRAAVGPHGYSKPLRRDRPRSQSRGLSDRGSSGILWQIPRPRGGVGPECRDGVWEAEVCHSEVHVGDARPCTRWARPVPPCMVPAAYARVPCLRAWLACCDSVRGVLLWLLLLQPLMDAAARADTSGVLLARQGRLWLVVVWATTRCVLAVHARA